MDMDEKRLGQRRLGTLDEASGIDREQSGGASDLGDGAALGRIDAFLGAVAPAHRHAWRVPVEQGEGMVMGDGDEGELDVLLGADLTGAAEDDPGDVDAPQRTVGVEDHADEVARLPVVALLDIAEDREHGGAHDVGVFGIGAFARYVAEHVGAVAAEYGGDADVALAGLDAVARELREAHADDQLVGDLAILVDGPGGAVELGVEGDGKVLQRVGQGRGVLVQRVEADLLGGNAPAS